MALERWYRYVSQAEKDSVEQMLEVKSRSGTTWYSRSRLSDWSDIQEDLALEDPRREYRLGPFYTDELPDFDLVPPRTVQPQKLNSGRWVPGGATEAATSKPHFIYGSDTVR